MNADSLVEMSEDTKRLLPSASFIFKLIVVMLFPLNLEISSYYTSQVWSSVLFTLDLRGSITFFPLLRILIALLLMTPCLVFEYHLHSASLNKKLRYRALGVSVLTWLIASGIFPFGYFLNYEMRGLLRSLATISVSFFVILPLILRESVIKSVSSRSHSLSYSFLTSGLGKKIRREQLLSTLLWIGLVFCPFVCHVYVSWGYFDLQFISIFYLKRVYSSPLIGVLPVLPSLGNLSLIIVEAVILPFMLLLSAIRFVFVRDVYRYRSKTVTKQRLLSVAVLGEILPPAILVGLMLPSISSSFFMSPLLPVPILPILGFIAVRFSRILPVKDELWPDVEHRMWFEKEKEPYVPQKQEESIKVPLAYLLVSQVRRRLKH